MESTPPLLKKLAYTAFKKAGTGSSLIAASLELLKPV